MLAFVGSGLWMGIILLLVVLLVLLGVFFWMRWRKRREDGSSGRPLWGELKKVWRPVRRDRSRGGQHLGMAVIAVNGVVWQRTGARDLIGDVSSSEEPALLRAHRKESVVILRLADSLLLREDKAASDALRRFAKELPGVVLLVLAVDYRELHRGSEQQLTLWAEAMGRVLPLLQKRGRSVGIRICMTGLETEPGYAAVRDLWVQNARPSWTLADIESTEAWDREFSAVAERTTSLLGASVVQFESAVRLLAALPGRLQVLSAFSRPLADAIRQYTQPELSGLFLTDAEGRYLPRSPFSLTADALTRARDSFREAAWKRTAALCGGICGLLLLGFLAHGLWLGRVAERVSLFRHQVDGDFLPGSIPGLPDERARPDDDDQRVDVRAASASPATSVSAAPNDIEAGRGGDVDLVTDWGLAPRAEEAGAGVRSLRYWLLPFAGTSQRASVGREFVDTTRAAFIAPLVDSSTSFARRVFATVLDQASTTNDFGALVSRHSGAWAAMLRMPPRTIDDFVRVRSKVSPPGMTLRDLDAAAESLAQWRKLVLEISSAVQTGVFSGDILERARRHPLLRELPASSADLRLLKQAVGLLTAELARSHPPLAGSKGERAVARLLQTELGFIERNLADLIALRAWLDETPSLIQAAAPDTLAHLLEAVAPLPAKDAKPPVVEAAAARILEIRFERQTERIGHVEFSRAVARTKARASYRAFLEKRCSRSIPENELLQDCPYRRSGYDGTAFFPIAPGGQLAEAVERYMVTGPGSGSYGPSASLPGRYTQDAFNAYVAPALGGLMDRLEGSLLPAEDRRGLTALIDGHLDAYGEGYFKALRNYYLSMRLSPVSLAAAKAALVEIAAPGSWFVDFVGTTGRQANLALDGVEAAGFRGALRPFSSLVSMSQGKGLEQYAKMLLAVLAEMDASETSLAGSGGKRLGEALAVLGALEGSAADEVNKWLDSEQILGEWRRPFEQPLEALRSHAMLEIRRYWQHEVVRPAAPMLRRYPFAAGDTELTVSVDEVSQEFGPQGRLWATVQEVLDPVVVAKRSRVIDQRRTWAMRPNLPEPEGLLDYLNAAERLTTLLWADDGKPRPLALALTPLELPNGTFGEPLIALAYLSLAGAGMQSFNQVSDETIVEVPWWSREPSTLTVEVLDEYASEVKAFYEAASNPGPFSFLKLLDSGCSQRRESTPCGELAWAVKKLPGAPLVKFELSGDVSFVFRELGRLASAEGVPVR